MPAPRDSTGAPTTGGTSPGPPVRLAELIAPLSLATDLGLGQPMEHVLRSCLIALRLGDEVGLKEADRAATYYVALLAWIGCSADAHELARWFGDDIAFRAATYDVDLAGPSMTVFLLRHLGAGSTALRRLRVAADFVVSGVREVERAMRAHCEVAGTFAERLGLGEEVRIPLRQMFERWDGKGDPGGLKGEQIALPVRIVHIAEIVEVFHRLGGVEGAVSVARARAGTQFDPTLVERFCATAPSLLSGLAEDTWDTVIASEPALRPPLSPDEFDAALMAMADFADLKSPYTLGHSRGVAGLAAEAARRLGLPEGDVGVLRRAALVHDLGRLGISNAIWDKPGPLTAAERERVRLHPYFTERILSRAPALARLGAIAARHHEHLDGSGYPQSLSGDALGPSARILAAADTYHAWTEPRPHRAEVTVDEVAAKVRAESRAGRLDGEAVEAVLSAAGHRARRRPERPSTLAPRELEVLRLVARGRSSREVAARLSISQKTARNHIEHIYLKIGVSSRAAASLFALRHGLLTDEADATGED